MPTQANDSKVRSVAQRLYRNREISGLYGEADQDWAQAERICKSPVRYTLFRLNQPLISFEKNAVEPLANWVERADIFRIIERISPAIEALGVLAIPLVLFFATQSYQDKLQQQEVERLQQQAIKDYLNQLSSILTTTEGNLHDPQNEQLQALTTATTLTLMNEPNLDGVRKGQIIKFLAQMNLVNKRDINGPIHPRERAPTLELNDANLSKAYLSGVNLRGASLKGADLSEANLIGADLQDADLSGANLTKADLSRTNLSNAKLSRANLISTDFNRADLSNVDLSNSVLAGAFLGEAELIGANLDGSNLSRAYLSYAKNISSAQLEDGFLCRTRLPAMNQSDRNRDCGRLLISE